MKLTQYPISYLKENKTNNISFKRNEIQTPLAVNNSPVAIKYGKLYTSFNKSASSKVSSDKSPSNPFILKPNYDNPNETKVEKVKRITTGLLKLGAFILVAGAFETLILIGLFHGVFKVPLKDIQLNPDTYLY